MAKRGDSGICAVFGVDKPQGKSSHDVVNACRRIFGERRVGHTGTLDPLATGALVICVGPATRLDAYMVGHDKTYDVRIRFGSSTDTDDCTGQIVQTMPVAACVADEAYARSVLDGFVGPQKQMPPAYSAIKRGGVKSCDAARKGTIIKLEARDIEVYGAQLLGIESSAASGVSWDVRLSVSKGTYIRSLARDIGKACSTCAHVETLRRVVAGRLDINDCVSLEALERFGLSAAFDPVYLLGMRMAFLNDEQAANVANGKTLDACELQLFEPPRHVDEDDCGPRRAAVASTHVLEDAETLCLVHNNRLKALYAYRATNNKLAPSCVFPQGVIRGKGF